MSANGSGPAARHAAERWGPKPIPRTADGRPVIHCTLDASGRTASFYCPHCRTRHVHGNSQRVTVPGSNLGGRAAHCHSTEGFSQYELVLGPEQFTPVRHKHFGQRPQR